MTKKQWVLMALLSPIILPPGGLVVWCSVLAYFWKQKDSVNKVTAMKKQQNSFVNKVKIFFKQKHITR